MGYVKKVVRNFGYGFISGRPDVFFHAVDVKFPFHEVQEGMPVVFDLEQAPQGPKARNVRVAIE